MVENEIYTVVGVVPIVTEGGCFCTPIFRDSEGRTLFAQSSSDGHLVDEFVAINAVIARPFVRASSNRVCRVGADRLSAFRFTDGSVVVDTRIAVFDKIFSSISEFRGDDDFLQYLMEKIIFESSIFELVSSKDNSSIILKTFLDSFTAKQNVSYDIGNSVTEYVQYKLPSRGKLLQEYEKALGKNWEIYRFGGNRYVDLKLEWPQVSPLELRTVAERLKAGRRRFSRVALNNVIISLLMMARRESGDQPSS